MATRQQTALLVIGDCLVFIAFALVGLSSHEEGITVRGVIRNAVPFGGAWVAVAALTGMYRLGWQHSEDGLMQKMASRWLVAWAVGLVVRSLYVWHWPVPAFAGVVLITAGIMLLLWRMVAAWLLNRTKVTV